MNKESLQYRRVDKCILNAFIKISPQIPFEKMTVQDILDEALVSRYTFYAHFHDKYEVAERIQDDLYRQFLLLTEERIPTIESQSLSSPRHHSFIDHEIIAFFQKNEPEMRAIKDIHTETIDFSRKIKDAMAARYLASNEERSTLTLESLLYSGCMAALMEYAQAGEDSLKNLSHTIFEAQVRVMAYAIGLHDAKSVDKLMEVTEKMVHP